MIPSEQISIAILLGIEVEIRADLSVFKGSQTMAVVQ